MKRTALVVDDDDGVRKGVLRVLFAEGFEAIGACDADAALQSALHRSPDLLIMDLQLPRVSGNEAVRSLRTPFPYAIHSRHRVECDSRTGAAHAVRCGAWETLSDRCAPGGD